MRAKNEILNSAAPTAAKTVPTEVEAKFAVEDPALLEELAASSSPVSGYCFGDPLTKVQQDVYLDTPDYHLLRHGYQLRVRAGDSRGQAALKSRGVGSEVGIYHRLEIEELLETGNLPSKVGELPEPIVDALSGIAGKSAELRTICVLDQTRRVRAVTSESPGRRSESAPALMELFLDEVRIRGAVDDAVLARAYEVEVELAKDVDLAELQVLADRFMGTYGLVPSTESKLERALRIVSRHPVNAPENWQGIHPELHMGEACRIIWHEQFMAMLLNEAGVRYSTDPEYVHAARVAIRRARAAARLYKDYFKRKGVRRYLKQIRKTAQLLGAVRDMDVAIAKLIAYRQKSRKKAAGSLQATLEEWVAKRARAHQELVAWLDSDNYAEFVRSFLGFCRTPGAELADMAPAAGEAIVPFQVRHVVPTMLLDNFAHVRAYEVWFEQEDEVPLATLHQLRIECKYLRYNLEFVGGLLGGESGAMIAFLKSLQEDLGDLQDAVVSKQLLGGGDSDDERVIARYEAAQDKTIAKLRRETREDFVRFVGEENRRRLLCAIANV